jgi:hypothetical protein
MAQYYFKWEGSVVAAPIALTLRLPHDARGLGEIMRIAFWALALAMLLAACATITKGTTQTVLIDTPNARGATCTLTSPAIGTKVVVTPAPVVLEKGKDSINVSCTKACYLDGVGIIPSNFQAMSAGNVIFGGIIGLGVDAASGAMNEYASQAQVLMQPDPKCQKSEPLPKHRR